MKSIIEEASSIFKAIEKAWERAGKPTEFSVKVFEDSQRSFFGLTKKQAKIGLFFGKAVTTDMPEEQKRKNHEPFEEVHSEGRYSAPKPMGAGQKLQDKPRQVAPKTPPREHHNTTAQQPPSHHGTTSPLPQQQKKKNNEWSAEIAKTVETWVKDIMHKSNLPAIPYIVEQRGNRLHIVFERPLTEDQAKNTGLFRSLSYIILGMIRSRYKKEFRFLKVVLTTQDQQSDDTTH